MYIKRIMHHIYKKKRKSKERSVLETGDKNVTWTQIVKFRVKS